MTQAGIPPSDSEIKANGGDETIIILRSEYERLIDVDLLMDCLINAGVDNWDYYGDALDEYYDLRDNQEVTEDDL